MKYKIKTKNKTINVSRILITAVIILVVFCGSGQTESEERFTFAYQDRIADAAAIIAVKKEFFKEEGLNINPMIFSSGPACTEALVYGNAQLATMGDTTSIVVISSKADSFKIICSHGGGEHRHRIIVSESSNIDSITELEGKRIGVKKGTSTHGGLLLFAKRNKLNLAEEVIDIAPEVQLVALAAGEVDAIVASEPTPSIAESKGYGHQLCTLGGLNNTYPIFILTNRIFAEQHPDIIVKMLKSLKRAGDFIEGNPDEATEILSKVTGLATPIIKKAMGFHYYDVSITEQTKESLKSIAQFLKEIGMIKDTPDFSKVIDESYLEVIKEDQR